MRNGFEIPVWSDHKSLSQKVVPHTWDSLYVVGLVGLLKLYPVRISYLPGQLNRLADWLSRNHFITDGQMVSGQLEFDDSPCDLATANL